MILEAHVGLWSGRLYHTGLAYQITVLDARLRATAP
jgi:hypothetical protein